VHMLSAGSIPRSVKSASSELHLHYRIESIWRLVNEVTSYAHIPQHQTQSLSNYELFNSNSISIRYWSWNYRGIHWRRKRVWFVRAPCLKRLGNLFNLLRIGDRCLQLFALNQECLVGALQQGAPNTSLPFVHTARRCNRSVQC